MQRTIAAATTAPTGDVVQRIQLAKVLDSLLNGTLGSCRVHCIARDAARTRNLRERVCQL